MPQQLYKQTAKGSYEQLRYVMPARTADHQPAKTQSEKCAEIQRWQDDSPTDWARMLEDLGTIENVDRIPLDDDADTIRLRWYPE